MVEPNREQRLRELFDRAISLPLDQQEQLIQGVGDELLAERLRALLAQDAIGTQGPLQRSPADGLQGLRRIGRYELLRELGTGGMGTVLLARQVEPVERLVALKMVHGDTDSQEILQRFAGERQALALMNHPGIARIFDGGTTDDGAPFFVMEYVRGEPITHYCDRRQLNDDARIDLFVKVCDAVQHAHQKAVLHRDLKPGNVLVTEEGGRPQPKVIDFGVMRALGGGPGLQQKTTPGMLIGTYAYMSPEQADPSGQDVDTRADVYSLGVLLYELLTGELPLVFDPAKDGVLGFQRKLLETPPPAASTRVQTMPADLQQERAHGRSTTPAALQRQLRGDLDWILMCALEKDRNRRYPSASELAADLLRNRRNEPVVAGPPTLAYRAAKFVRRHRVMVLGATLLLLGLTFGLVGAIVGMNTARSARDAEAAARVQQARQLQRERAVHDFFEFLLFYGDPGTGGGAQSLRQVIDTLAPTLTPRLAGKPVEESAVRAAVGRVYLATGEPAKAEKQLARAWQIVAADDREDPAVACLLLHDLSRSRRLAGGPGAGRDELRKMLELGAAAVARQEPALAGLLQQLIVLVPIDGGEWSTLQARCDELLDRVAGLPWDAEATRIAGNLLAAIGMRLQEEELPGAASLLDRLELIVRRSLGEDVDFLQVLGRFAESQLRLGRFAAAQRLATEVLDGLVRLAVTGHWLQLRAERIRGLALALSDEPAAGETALIALQTSLRSLPPVANEQARAAGNVLTELCVRLTRAGQLDAFLAASLGRWQQIAVSDPAGAPWWPADVEGLPGPTLAVARTCVERAIGDAAQPLAPPHLQGLRGSLLLREGRAEAATADLEAALVAAPQPWPELQADAAIARARVGRATAAAELVAELRARGTVDGPLAARVQRAVQRILAAGLH